MKNSITYQLENDSHVPDRFWVKAKYQESDIAFSLYNIFCAERANLKRIFVLPSFRNQGVGSQMFSIAKADLKKKGIKQLDICFGKDPDADKFMRFISHHKPTEIILYAFFYKVDFSIAENTFLHRYFVDNEQMDLQYKFYVQLTEYDIKHIYHYAETRVPDFSNPVANDSMIDKELSIFVYDKNNQIMAWTIVEALRPNELSFTLSYVTPEQRMTALGLKMEYLIFKQMQEIGCKKYQFATFEVFLEDRRVARLNERIFGNSIISKSPCYKCSFEI